MEFHWWYLPVALVVFFLLFRDRKGGVVVTRYSATLEVLDPRFADCRPEADYSIFKEGTPDHIEIELEGLAIPPGDELEFRLNGELLAVVRVERDHEAEFDHWSDEGVDFPRIHEGDELVIRYRGADVLQGTFS